MKINFYIGLISLALLLNACKEETSQTQPITEASVKIEASQENTTLPLYMVGSEINYEPFSFLDENGLPTGFEVELLTAIGKAAGFRVQFNHEKRSEVENTLKGDVYKIWASSLYISPERMEKMDFSDPYIEFVREIYLLDNPQNANIQTAEDFKGRKIAVNRSSKSAIAAATEITGSQENVVLEDSFYLSLKAVYSGKADGSLGDKRILQYYQLKHPQITTRAISLGDTPKEIAFAIKKGDTELLEKINYGLKIVRESGEYKKLLEKWFGNIN